MEDKNLIQAINNKALEMLARIVSVSRDELAELNKDERGQTATEYVAILVVAVALAIGIVYGVLSGVLEDVINTIGDELTAFTNSVFA